MRSMVALTVALAFLTPALVAQFKLPVNLDCPKSPAALIDRTAVAFHGSGGFFFRHQRREVTHHLWVRVHRGERLQIGVLPLAEREHQRSDRL